MKKILSTLILLTGFLTVAIAETFNFQAYAFCTRDNTTNIYSKWEPSTITGSIYINGNNGAVYIYSDNKQLYTIISSETDANGNIYMYCNDITGTRCQVRLQTDPSNNTLHLYIDYNDWTWGYLIQPVK